MAADGVGLVLMAKLTFNILLMATERGASQEL